MSNFSVTYGAPQIHASEALNGLRPKSFAAIKAASTALGSELTVGQLVAALRSLHGMGYASHCKQTRSWMLTRAGLAAWEKATAEPEPTPEPEVESKPLIPVIDPALLVRNVSRFATHNSSSFVQRPGSMDHAEYPRIQGCWRVWPCGRRERIGASNKAA